jgi:hypothetical protein
MEGASVAPEALAPASATGSFARRRIVLMAGLAVLTFAAAFGVGLAVKHRTARPNAIQLAPTTQASGPRTVSIARIQATGAIAGLKSPPKPKPRVSSTPTQSGSQGGTPSGSTGGTPGGTQGTSTGPTGGTPGGTQGGTPGGSPGGTPGGGTTSHGGGGTTSGGGGGTSSGGGGTTSGGGGGTSSGG